MLLLIASSLFGRLHSTVIGLVLTLAVQEWTDSYALPGLALGALTLGQAVSGPRRGRAIDRAPRSSLLLCAIGYSTGLLIIGLVVAVGGPNLWPVVVVASLLTGLLLPAIPSAVRVAMPQMIPPALIRKTLTVEATAQEVIFVGGPMLAVVALSAWAPTGALLATGVIAGVGGLLFVAVFHSIVPPLRTVSAGGRSDLQRSPSLLSHASARLKALFAIHALVLCNLTAMTLTLVTAASGSGEPHAAGWLEAAIATGSLIGGVIGSKGWLDRLSLAGRLAGMTGGASVLAVATMTGLGLPMVGISLALAGFWLAPILALHSALLLDSADDGRTGETFAWGGTITLTTVSIVAPVVGLALDALGPSGGALLAIALAAAATVVARHRSL